MSPNLLNARASAAESSPIRDLLDQAARPGMISLAGGLPDPMLFPLAELSMAAAEVVSLHGGRTLQYGVTRGEEVTRAALAGLIDGSNPASVVVTTGAQQGLDLIARVLVESGDVVVTGDPEYLGLVAVLRSYGARPHPVPQTDTGLDTERLERDLKSGLRPKACYVIPHFHNPTGVSISASRRAHLHELSSRYGFMVIEDDPYRWLYYDDRRPLDSQGDPALTVRLWSTSKVLAPGLRIGALDGPGWLVEAIIRQKQAADLHTSTFSQALVVAALGAPWFDAHVAQLRNRYRAKRDLFVGLLRGAFGDQLNFAVPDGGMFLWAEDKGGFDTAPWLVRSLEEGVCFVPGQAFAVDSDLRRFLRLSFVTATEADLAAAVGRLAHAY